MLLLDSSAINEVVLAVAALVLLCGSAGLVLVWHNSPLLRGLGFVAASFALGGSSALLAALHHRLPVWMSVQLAGMLMLLCFLALHRAVLSVGGESGRLHRLSLGLLGLQIALTALSLNHFRGLTVFLVGSGPLIALRTAATGFTLLRTRRKTAQTPALLCAFLLFAYALLLVVRLAVLTAGLLRTPFAVTAVETFTSIAMLAAVLGIAFGFFWMTTSTFASGLERMASTDPLTRIFNRRSFLLWCEKEVARSLATGSPFSLLLLDLDHFKQVNDTFGHTVGDQLLCTIVERVQDGVRGIDVLGRWGGEEFAVLLPRASADAAFLVAERVRKNIERMAMPLHGAERQSAKEAISATASFGTATFSGESDSIDAMLQRADTALYAAKRGGRNRTVSSHELPPPPVPEPQLTPWELAEPAFRSASESAPALVTQSGDALGAC